MSTRQFGGEEVGGRWEVERDQEGGGSEGLCDCGGVMYTCVDAGE